MHTSLQTHVRSSVCSWKRRPHCSFHLPTPFSACCWHHYVNTNTVFLSSSPGPDILLDISLSSPGVRGIVMGAWRDLGHGWIVGNQSAVCGLAACNLLPLPPFFLYLCFSFGRESYKASCRSHIVASNDLGKHALLKLRAHLNPTQPWRRARTVYVYLCGCARECFTST